MTPPIAEATANPAALFSVEGLTVVVTGGGRGIGSMIAGGLVRAGARVVVVGRKQASLDGFVESLPESSACVAVAADVASPEGIERVEAAVRAQGDRVHALINNAGAVWAAPFDDYPLSGFEKVLAVNLVAPFRLTQALHPLLQAAADAGGPARVVNIGSTDGILPPRYETYSYSASKAGLHMLTRHLAHRFRSDGITVNTVAPGLFPTDMTSLRFRDEATTEEALNEIPVGRAGSPDDIVAAAIYLCSRGSSYVTGAVLPVDGGYSSLR